MRRAFTGKCGRASAPLIRADDAEILDNTHLGVEESWQAALAIVARRQGLGAPK